MSGCNNPDIFYFVKINFTIHNYSQKIYLPGRQYKGKIYILTLSVFFDIFLIFVKNNIKTKRSDNLEENKRGISHRKGRGIRH